MNTQRVIGIALIVLGVVLLIVGFNSSESLVDQVSETFTGRFTQTTMRYIIGGAASAVVGVLLLAIKRKG